MTEMTEYEEGMRASEVSRIQERIARWKKTADTHRDRDIILFAERRVKMYKEMIYASMQKERR